MFSGNSILQKRNFKRNSTAGKHTCAVLQSLVFRIYSAKHLLVVSCRQELATKVQCMASEMHSLQNALDAQEQRHKQLGQTLAERVCQGSPAQMFESSFAVEAIESDGFLPARCGHLVLPIQASGVQVAVCIGGIEGEDWQATCFGAVCMHEDMASSKVRLQICSVHSNVQEPLDLCEAAACAVGDNNFLLCGGRTGGEERNSVWLGKPLIHTSNEVEGSHMSREGVPDSSCTYKCGCKRTWVQKRRCTFHVCIVDFLAARSGHHMARSCDWIYHFHCKMPAYGFLL